MNKIAQYLNSNLTGEAISTQMVRLAYSRDRSVLRLIPSCVIYPRSTEDVRKISKLTYQLGEKGKAIGVTARGKGHSQTGSAIGQGLLLDFNHHLDQVIDIDVDQGLVHVQAGAEFGKVQSIVESHGLYLPFEAKSNQTIGGIIASNNAKLNLSKVTNLADTIDQMEVVLCNGDLMQVKPLSRREFEKKLGLSNFEGEIYRKIDKILEDNQTAINKIDNTRFDSLGYHSVASLRQKDGGINLIPLFIASQGTLGLITEVILKLDILGPNAQVIAASFLSVDDALDAQEAICKLAPTYCEIYHTDILSNAIENGKSFSFYDQSFEAFAQAPSAYLLARFNLKNKLQSKKIANKLKDIVTKSKGFSILSDETNIEQLEAIRDIPLVFNTNQRGLQNVALVNGLQIPIYRFNDFVKGLKAISEKLNINLPYYGSCTSGIMNIQTEFDLKLVSDRQKVFRLMASVTKLIHDIDGIFCAGEGEGRLKAGFAYQSLDPRLAEIFKETREVFDPFHTLNPGVKEPVPLKDLIASTVNDYYNGIFY